MLEAARGFLGKLGLFQRDNDDDSFSSYASRKTYSSGTGREPYKSIDTPTQLTLWESQGVEQIRDLIQASVSKWDGADAIFCLSMNDIRKKQLKALEFPDSVPLFSEFAEEYTRFLDRFGPGGIDSHRAPISPSWMVKLLIPFLKIDHNESEERLDMYEDVTTWLTNLLPFLGPEGNDIILNQGAWDAVLAKLQVLPYNIGFEGECTLSRFTFELEPDSLLVHKILSIRPTSAREGLKELLADELNMCLSLILHKIELRINTLSRSQITNYMDLIEETVAGLVQLEEEETDTIIAVAMEDFMLWGYHLYRQLEKKLNKQRSLSHQVM